MWYHRKLVKSSFSSLACHSCLSARLWHRLLVLAVQGLQVQGIRCNYPSARWCLDQGVFFVQLVIAVTTFTFGQKICYIVKLSFTIVHRTPQRALWNPLPSAKHSSTILITASRWTLNFFVVGEVEPPRDLCYFSVISSAERKSNCKVILKQEIQSRKNRLFTVVWPGPCMRNPLPSADPSFLFIRAGEWREAKKKVLVTDILEKNCEHGDTLGTGRHSPNLTDVSILSTLSRERTDFFLTF